MRIAHQSVAYLFVAILMALAVAGIAGSTLITGAVIAAETSP